MANSKEGMMAEIQDRATVNVQLTQESAEKVRQFMVDENLTPENSALRVSVLPGGMIVICYWAKIRRLRGECLARCR